VAGHAYVKGERFGPAAKYAAPEYKPSDKKKP